jgi:hypothetical protein
VSDEPGAVHARCVGFWANNMPHKFILGQAVEYHPPGGHYAPPGIYVVTAKLAERDGEFEYYIKHTKELYERIARESELRGVQR